jgi:hypothetical protein
MRTEALFAWITERHAIYEAKNAGYPKPWTEDPILRAYRFCNVYRELDKVTQWIAKHWREPHIDDEDVWFAMTVARLVNWPDTLEELGYPVPFDPTHFINVLERRKLAKEKAFTGVYIVPAKAGFSSKAKYLASEVLNPMWCQRNDITESAYSLADFHKQLMKYNGMGSFLAGQVVCDTKYTRLLADSVDWTDWACSGPGSKRGLNRVMERPVDQVWQESMWLDTMLDLRRQINPMVAEAGMPEIHMQDLQNCLCEFDKYERVRLGEGKPRNGYPGLR